MKGKSEYTTLVQVKHVRMAVCHFGNISLPVYLLVILFAIASWIDINGLFVELPIMVDVLPEGWDLPSYLIIIIQVANIGPLTYVLCKKIWPDRVKEWPAVYIIITIGAASCLLLIGFWDKTTFIFGKERSSALILLSFFLAMVDTTSSVVFLPYMAMFKVEYMTPFYIGEGFSSLLPGLLGLAQGIGGDPTCVNTSSVIYNETLRENLTIYTEELVYSEPRFSIEIFFLCLFSMICISGISFTLLHFTKLGKRERFAEKGNVNITDFRDKNNQLTYSKENDAVVYQFNDNLPDSQKVLYISTELSDADGLRSSQYVFLLTLTVWINALTNGLLPGLQTYASLPYGSAVYSLTARLSSIANPLFCFFGMFYTPRNVAAIGCMTLFASVLSAYQIVLASLSPDPPLKEESLGAVLAVTTAVLLTGVFSYSKMAIASRLRAHGQTALVWCGMATQLGSLIGAMISFTIVNILALFTAEDQSVC